MPRKKSKKLRVLEEKLKIVKKELTRRKKAQNVSSPSKSKRGRKSTKSVFEECVALLEKVKKMQYSKAFLQAVDWKALNIPTYPKIIKHPMDLKTVESKINNASYHTPYHFARDMRLIYQNATTFNKPNTPYFIAATKFGKKFEEEFERRIVELHENNEFTRKISKVITSLIRRDDSIPFRAPVNPQVLEIPDYLDMIETPMDLGTILNKINYYTQFKHFVHDLFLVWDNCCRYNPKHNQIHQTALKLRDYTQKQLNRFCQSDFQMWQEDDGATPPAYSASSLSMNMNMHSNKQNPPNHSASNTNSAPRTLVDNEALGHDHDHDDHEHALDAEPPHQPHDHEEQEEEEDDEEEEEEEEGDEEQDIFKLCDEEQDEEESNRMMISFLFAKHELDQSVIGNLDFQQKEELQRGIQCLDSDHFDPLINMLQSFIPEGEGDDDEVELDVDSIDDPLQVKMYNYMLRAIHQQENERIKREGGKVVAVLSQSAKQSSLEQNDNDIAMVDNSMDEESKMDNNISPNVVNAFPINGNDEMSMGLQLQMNEDGNGGLPMQMNEERDGDMDGEEEDGDGDMDGNGDIDMMDNGDIVADIANVIESMPVVDGDGDDNDGGVGQVEVGLDVGIEEEEGNDNDVTDTEIVEMDVNEQREEEQEAAVNGQCVKESEENMNIPTMPMLQTVNDNEMENDGKEAENGNYEATQLLDSNDNVESVRDNVNDIGNDGIVAKIVNENESMDMNYLLNENDANLNVNGESAETEQNEEDDVDTPLADEIEF